jgi:hypothetical protein
MASEPTIPPKDTDLLYVRVAREIAIEHHDIETILKRYQISDENWQKIQRDTRFIELLKSEIAEWQGATNTHERTKLKAAALLEEYLPEANTRLHDAGENLPAKVELAKLMARIAGMGLNNADIIGGSGERFSVTINLGADQSLRFEKTVTPKVIEGTVNE